MRQTTTQPTVREINRHLGKFGYCYVTIPRADGLPGGDRFRIIRARTNNGILEAQALSSGRWEQIPNAHIELI